MVYHILHDYSKFFFGRNRTRLLTMNSLVSMKDANRLCHPLCILKIEIFNAEVLIREDITVDEFIDVVLGNRKYIQAIYVSNFSIAQECTLLYTYAIQGHHMLTRQFPRSLMMHSATTRLTRLQSSRLTS